MYYFDADRAVVPHHAGECLWLQSDSFRVALAAFSADVPFCFFFFISLSARYALVYGSLASVMILMMWLYTCANIVMIGISLNIVLTKRKEERQKINCVKKK